MHIYNWQSINVAQRAALSTSSSMNSDYSLYRVLYANTNNLPETKFKYSCSTDITMIQVHAILLGTVTMYNVVLTADR